LQGLGADRVCLDMHPQRDVLVLDTHHAHLPLAMREAYLSDLQAWVAVTCRAAARRVDNRAALGLIDTLFGRAPAADVSRWQSIGPHAALRRAHGLSDDAVSVLLLATAPRLWGTLSHVYAAICSGGYHFVLGAHVIGALLGDRRAVATELARTAPLVTHGLVTLRPTGAVMVSPEVVCRLAGT
jgi:hypothetical protein